MCSARMRNGILPMLFNGLWDKTKRGDDKVCNPFVPRRSFIEWRGESSFSEWRQRMNWVDNQFNPFIPFGIALKEKDSLDVST